MSRHNTTARYVPVGLSQTKMTLQLPLLQDWYSLVQPRSGSITDSDFLDIATMSSISPEHFALCLTAALKLRLYIGTDVCFSKLWYFGSKTRPEKDWNGVYCISCGFTAIYM